MCVDRSAESADVWPRAIVNNLSLPVSGARSPPERFCKDRVNSIWKKCLVGFSSKQVALDKSWKSAPAMHIFSPVLCTLWGLKPIFCRFSGCIRSLFGCTQSR